MNNRDNNTKKSMEDTIKTSDNDFLGKKSRKKIKLKRNFSYNNLDLSGTSDKWKVLIVDDEEAIHTVTRLALDDFTFQGRKITFLDAKSAEEAKNVMEENPDIAVILLDVVMETSDAGLALVKYVRETLGNNFVRIVLRTGQPGQAPEKKVIRDYAIDDYKTKTELTQDKLFTVVLASMRTYEAMMTVESYRQNLEERVKERTRELEEANQELQKVNATKDKFFSIIAHDLKNPLTSMIGFSDMMSEFMESFSEKQLMDTIKVIQSSSKKLYKLLENLLEWSRCQLGTIRYEPEKIDMNFVSVAAIDLLQESAALKDIKLHSTVPKNTIVVADRNMVITILRNLASNAIKFTPEGGEIKIESRINGKFVEFSVVDNGIGIKAEIQDKLFQIGTHHTTLGTKEEKGTGLGLILCKEFIEKHGGKIWVESEEGKGSKFKFTLQKAAD
jgi:signal transduction histidine kinase